MRKVMLTGEKIMDDSKSFHICPEMIFRIQVMRIVPLPQSIFLFLKQNLAMSNSFTDNPYGIAIVVWSCILIPTCILAVGLRLWARRLKQKTLVSNDWTIIAALVGRIIIQDIQEDYSRS